MRTGVTCVLAGTVAYPAQFRERQDTNDSNELLFNLLSEMRRGIDVDGTILSGAPEGRAYIVHIARAGMQAMTAASKALDESGLTACFFEVSYDDGSGESTLVTSPVLVQ